MLCLRLWSYSPPTSSLKCRLLPVLGVLISALLGGAAAVAAESPFRFTDVTSATGVDFVHTIGDDKLDNIVESSGVGCALLDYDGDGWLDVYFVNGIYREGLSDPRTPNKDRLVLASDRLYREPAQRQVPGRDSCSGDRARGIRHGGAGRGL